MKKIHLAITILSVLITGIRTIDDPPEVSITNGIIKAQLFLPDPVNGYYRGSRFDWSGIMPVLEYKGHSYFGQWFTRYSPTLHEAVMGPAEDFLPVAYDEAKPGETFLKIGIGMLTKPVEREYSIVTPYQIKNHGTWKVNKKKDQVEFMHALSDEKYAYQYTKTVRLVKGKPSMEILHSLKNTGQRTIETDVYNHNFFWIDKVSIGPNYTVEFPFQLSGKAEDTAQLGSLDGKRIIFLKELARNRHLHYQHLSGYGKDASDYNIHIENHSTRAGVIIRGDKPLSRVAFWSHTKAICPEPYTRIHIEPGKTMTWKISYQFYTRDSL